MNEKSFDILSVLGRKASLETFIEYVRTSNNLYSKYIEKINPKERDD